MKILYKNYITDSNICIKNLSLEIDDLFVILLLLQNSNSLENKSFVDLNFSGNSLCLSKFYQDLSIVIESVIPIEHFDLSYNLTNNSNDTNDVEDNIITDFLLLLSSLGTFHYITLKTININSCGILFNETNIEIFINQIFKILTSCDQLVELDISYLYQINLSKNLENIISKLKLGCSSSKSLKKLSILGFPNSDVYFSDLHNYVQNVEISTNIEPEDLF